MVRAPALVCFRPKADNDERNAVHHQVGAIFIQTHRNYLGSPSRLTHDLQQGEFRSADLSGITNSTVDVILDFSAAEDDEIRFDGLDADVTISGDQAFVFIGTEAFSGAAGELRFEQIGSNTFVQSDTDGDGEADLWIRLVGLHTLESDHFVL
jgi:hypothetical protein